jgi:23S rRNA-/tRNA-specific pseudouridylate synthase
MERKPHARILKSESGSMLLDWLSARFTYLSADEWRGMLAEGRVRVDGASAGPERVLSAKEVVAFDPPPYEEPPVDSSYTVRMEDEDYLVVDKSGNLPCHPSGRFYKHSLWYLLCETYGEVHIATRLDRETSGLVLACRSAAIASYAEGQLARGEIGKEYLVLVHGRFPLSYDARGYLIPDSASAIRKKRRYVEEASSAQDKKAEACATYFELIDIIDQPSTDPFPGAISLLRARPRTGRTHQIRATLLSLGFPLVGDKLYGLDEAFFVRHLEGHLNTEDLTRLMLPNQALHCSGLSFPSPSGRKIDLESRPSWAPAPKKELPFDGSPPFGGNLHHVPWRI